MGVVCFCTPSEPERTNFTQSLNGLSLDYLFNIYVDYTCVFSCSHRQVLISILTES